MLKNYIEGRSGYAEAVENEENGTAYNIKSDKYKIAGKTGTCQVDYNTENVQYVSSFVGYFPANEPKYSCIVVIHKPNKKKGYYGNMVAAPVFKSISDQIFSSIPKLEGEIKLEQLNSIEASKPEDLLNSINIDIKEIKGKTLLINLLLENLGFKVESIGEGLNIKDYRLENIVENKNTIELLQFIRYILHGVNLISVRGSTNLDIKKIEFDSEKFLQVMFLWQFLT